MDFATVSVMLIASLLHASWHSLIKSSPDQFVGLAGMGLVAALAAIPFAAFLPPPSVAVWAVIGVSVALHVTYKICLSIAYGHGDLGQAFPLSRGAVPLFAMLIALWTLGQIPTTAQLAGIALVCGGLLLLTIERLGHHPNWPLIAAVAGAGLMVAGYTVLDAYGTRLADHWASFTAWLIITDNFTFLAITRVLRGRELWSNLAAEKRRVIVSGVLGLASFSAFLWALSRHPVGAVSALRETSVLFAVLIGVFMHREQLSLRRVCGAILIVAGIIRVAT